jgi:hypothetical protein
MNSLSKGLIGLNEGRACHKYCVYNQIKIHIYTMNLMKSNRKQINYLDT